MNRKIVSLVCSALMLGSATYAQAGAYGETEELEERPAPAPAPRRPMKRVEQRRQTSDFTRSGPYLQVGGVYAWENFDASVNIPPAPGVTNGEWDDSWGYQIRGGYRISPVIAVELEWEHYLDFDYDGVGPSNGRDLESYILTGNAKVYPFYALADRFQPYLLGGLGWQNAQAERANFHDVDEDALALRFGLGADVYFTEMVGMAAEAGYVLPVTGELSDEDIHVIPVSLSIFVRFM